MGAYGAIQTKGITVTFGAHRGWPWMTQREPLASDFMSLGSKLEQLGFAYRNSTVMVIEVFDG